MNARKLARIGRLLWMVPVVAAALLGAPRAAHAITGAVTGSVRFWNRNGNFCPSSNACAGSRYPQSQFDTWQPVANAAVIIVNSGTLAVMGTGVTGNDGTYTIGYSSTFPVNFRVVVAAKHGENRFFFASPSGTLVTRMTGTITRTNSSISNPQNVGAMSIGTSAAPDAYFNSYWGAERVWRDTMSLVGVLVGNLTGVEIRGFSDNIPGFGNSPTSSANGTNKRIQLDAAAGFSPQARVMHELGHIASYITHPWKVLGGGDYTWSSTSTPGANVWAQDTAEWSSAGFEEAFATHYGNIAFWWDNATTPTTCLTGQAGSCYTGNPAVPAIDTDIEATSFPHESNNCGSLATNPERRWPLSIMRFLWDVFDNRNDADGDTYSASQGNFWQHLANLVWYPEGTGTDQIDEPWNPAKTALDQKDGRGALSYVNNYQANMPGVNVFVLWIDNCGPP